MSRIRAVNCTEERKGGITVDNERNMYTVFSDWIYSACKRSIAIQLCKTLEQVDWFLHETGTIKRSFLELMPNDMLRCVGDLNRNRVFKFRYREAMPWLGKLSNALSDFAASEEYTEALAEFGITPIQQERRGNTTYAHSAVPVGANDAELQVQAEEQVVEASIPFDKELLDVSLQDTEEADILPEERPEEKAVRSILEKCVIKLNGAAISREAISQSFLSYLSDVSTQHEHNVGITLHTGAIIFDALAVLWAAVSSMLANETSPEDLVRSLRKSEDLVTYKKMGRCRFEGIVEMGGITRAKLVQDEKRKETIYVPVNLWSEIIPYQGKSKRLDGRGSKSQGAKRKKFYTDVLNIEESNIPSITDTSTVFVMPREKADMLVRGLSICHNRDTFNLLDLVTASWYTDNDEYNYSGNAGKNEPVLKFTGRVSTGRKLLLKRGGNKNVGLFVCDDDELRRGESELPELFNRKALHYVHVLADIDMEQGEKLVADNETAEVFACTKDFLLSCPLQIQEDNPYTQVFSKQVDAILDHEISSVIVSGFVDWKTWRDFRQTLFNMKDSDYESQEKNDFIVDAWSLFNLFQTAVFPMRLIENMIENGKVSIGSPGERIRVLYDLSYGFPDDLKNSALHIVEILDDVYQLLLEQDDELVYPISQKHAIGIRESYYQQGKTEVQYRLLYPSGKAENLIRLIMERADKRVCVVVPKRYYETVMRESGLPWLMENPENLTITTANQFDSSEIYDTIIVAGEFRGKRFDSFRCMSAREVISILYNCEQNQYRVRKKQSRQTDRILNERSFVQVNMDDAEETSWQDGATEEELQQLDHKSVELDSYIDQLAMTLPSIPGYSRGTEAGTREVEIAAIATFDTGERAFFTPFYKACVFDEANGKVDEKRISDFELSEGDMVVFTRNDDEMHDIVDDIMQMLIENGRLKESEHVAHGMSKVWKNKLRMYMKLSGMKAGAVAKRMTDNGVSITSQTIRIWIDPDAHTVGPRDPECIRQIGLIVGDNQMAEHPEETMEACRIIRQRRRRILDVIEMSIHNKLGGKTNNTSDPIEQEIYSRIDSQADILRVESFIRMKKTMLATFVNKPVSL